MNSDQQQIDEVFSEAVLLPQNARHAFLQKRCADLPPKIRDEVEKLLEVDLASDKLADTEANPHLNVSKFLPHSNNEGIGQRIGRYKLLEQIGEGGMGVVFMALQEAPVERQVALKLIKPGMDSKQVIARFEAERQALAMMEHPNIAKVFDVGVTDSGRPYFVMELVKGIPITEYCEQRKLDTKERLKIFVAVCRAVTHAHQKGIIHRDIKPSNVLLAEYDDELVPKVIDFGVAKATTRKLTDKTAFTGFGQLIGTFEYMSPEQAKLNQLDVDTRTDIYSLGVLLYELLTGTTPFDSLRLRSAALDEVMRIIAEEEPPRPSTRITTQSGEIRQARVAPRVDARAVEGELDWIVMKSLEKSRGRRYQTAKDFADDIRRHLEGGTVNACPPTLRYRTQKFVRKYVWQVGVTAILLTFFVATSFLGWRLALVNDREKDLASAKLVVETAMRMTAEANVALDAEPVKSTRYALAAVQKASEHNDEAVLSLAKFALNRAAARLGGTPLVGHDARIRSASFSNDGCWLATSSQSRDGVWLWDLKELKRSVSLPHASVGHVAISNDSRWLVTGGRDGSVKLWQLEQAGVVAECTDLSAGRSFITSLAISADNRKLVVGCDDGQVNVWDLRVDNPAATKITLRAASELNTKAQVGISANGRWLASGSHCGTAFVWDLEASDPASTPLAFEHGEAIVRLAISPDGHWMVTGGESPILWDLTASSPVLSATALKEQASVSSIVITDDANKLVVAGCDGSVCIYDLRNVNPASSCLTVIGHEGIVRSVEISQDHRWLVTGGDDHLVRVWDLASVEELELPSLSFGTTGETRLWFANRNVGVSHQIRGHDGWVSAVAMSGDGKRLVTGDWNGNLRLWDLGVANPSANRTVERNSNVQVVSVSANGKWLAVGRRGPHSRLWRLNASGVLRDAFDLQETLDGLGSMVISADSRWLLATSAVPAFRDASNYQRNESVARLWDLTADDPGKPIFELSHQDAVRAVAMSGNGKYAVTGCEDGTARVWDLSNGCIQIHDLGDLNEPVSSVSMNYDGDLVAIGCHGGHAVLWEPFKSPATVRKLPGHNTVILKIAVSPDGRWVATGGSEDPSRVFDLNSARPLRGRVIPGHGFYTTSLEFSADNQWFASGGWNKTTQVWRLRNDEPFKIPYATDEAASGVDSLLFSFDSRTLLIGGYGAARLLQLADPASTMNLPASEGTAIGLTPDGRYAVTAHLNRVSIWALSGDELADYANRIIGNLPISK